MSAFKNWINKDLLKKMAKSIQNVYPKFDAKQFVGIAIELESLELKPRVHRVRDQLHSQLPKDFPKALDILLQSIESGDLHGFALWPYTEFIQKYGIDDLSRSLPALKKITKLFTSEFAIRPFIKTYPTRSLQYLLKCSKDKDVHVRRWSSEGSRPRLPWGERLDIFIEDPSLVLPILENLKYDSELYVRKSVSNHLNDIAKDNPSFVIDLLKRWKKAAPAEHQIKIQWIIARALRTLIKEGHPNALELLGVQSDVPVEVGSLRLNKNRFKVDERLEFEFEIRSKAKKNMKLIVDYIIHYVKSNKETSPKVFKLKNLELKPGEKITIRKGHHLKVVTTRRHYPGRHMLEIQVNGKRYSAFTWHLSL